MITNIKIGGQRGYDGGIVKYIDSEDVRLGPENRRLDVMRSVPGRTNFHLER